MKAFTIFKAVTKNWIRSRSGLFFSILFPILLLIVFGLIFSGIGGSSNFSLFIQNQDTNAASGKPSDLSLAFINALNNSKTFSITDIPVDANATTYVRDQLGPMGGNMRILIIDQGFQDNLVQGTFKVRIGICYYALNDSYRYIESNMTPADKAAYQQGLAQIQLLNNSLPNSEASLTIMTDPSDQSAAMVQSIIASIGNAFNYEMIGAQNVLNINSTTVTTSRIGTVDLYVPGITAAFIMTNGIIALTSINTEFKRRGIIKRLSITPLTKLDWILGNILSQTLLNLMLTGIMIGVGWIIFQVRIIPDVYTIVMILLGSMMFCGIGMTLSGFIKDVEAASAIGNAIAFPMMFLSGTYFPLEMMPSYLQSVSKVLPLTYFSEGLKASMLYKYPEGIFFNMAVVGVLAVVFITLGALVTRWKAK